MLRPAGKPAALTPNTGVGPLQYFDIDIKISKKCSNKGLRVLILGPKITF